MCVTESRNACQNRGPKAPCGLLSIPCSLGEEPPSLLPVAEGLCETFTLLLDIGSATPSPLDRLLPRFTSSARACIHTSPTRNLTLEIKSLTWHLNL